MGGFSVSKHCWIEKTLQTTVLSKVYKTKMSSISWKEKPIVGMHKSTAAFYTKNMVTSTDLFFRMNENRRLDIVWYWITGLLRPTTSYFNHVMTFTKPLSVLTDLDCKKGILQYFRAAFVSFSLLKTTCRWLMLHNWDLWARKFSLKWRHKCWYLFEEIST